MVKISSFISLYMMLIYPVYAQSYDESDIQSDKKSDVRIYTPNSVSGMGDIFQPREKLKMFVPVMNEPKKPIEKQGDEPFILNSHEQIFPKSQLQNTANPIFNGSDFDAVRPRRVQALDKNFAAPVNTSGIKDIFGAKDTPRRSRTEILQEILNRKKDTQKESYDNLYKNSPPTTNNIMDK